MLWKLFKHGVHVKPMRAHDESAWVTTSGPNWRDLLDDRRRYGWRVALHNLLIVLGLVRISKPNSHK